MADQTQRLEVATVKAEIGSDILSRFANDGVEADPIQTNSGELRNLKQIVADIEDKASFSSGIYPDVASGLADAAEGGMFLVASSDEDEIYEVWRKQGGVGVDTGKRALSSSRVVEALAASEQYAHEAEESAEIATSAASNVELSKGIFSTVAKGLAATSEDGYFSVPADSAGDYLILYHKVSGAAIETKRYPSSEALSAISKLVGSYSSDGSESEYFMVTDEEASRIAVLTNKRLKTIPFEIYSDGSNVLIGDQEGGIALQVTDWGVRLGCMEFMNTDMPGIRVTDREGGIIFDLSGGSAASPTDSTINSGIMFSPRLAIGPAGLSLFVAGLIKDRTQASDIVASVGSDTTAESSQGRRLRIGSDFGATGTLVMRSSSAPDYRLASPFSVAKIARGASARTVNILFIGDSIGNREGMKLLGEYLAELNITANFIGTINSSSLPLGGNDALGPLCEAREGWESGDFTYAVTDRVSMVTPGDEAAYLALSKTAKWPINPFLRTSTGSDSAAIVRNGRVFDCAFYQSRFGLATPDIVINALGTNDVRDRPASTIYADVLDGDNIIHAQVLAAWPSAKILRTFPGTGSNSARDAVWATHYTQVLAAIKASAASRPAVKIAPLWAVTDPESEYALPTTTNADGDFVGDWSDSVHPIGSSRKAYYQAMAPFVVAALDSLI